MRKSTKWRKSEDIDKMKEGKVEKRIKWRKEGDIEKRKEGRKEGEKKKKKEGKMGNYDEWRKKREARGGRAVLSNRPPFPRTRINQCHVIYQWLQC